MIRQRALAWAAVLALVATVSIAPLPARFSAPVTSALAQGDSAADAGEPADLAIAALHCAEAPATEALTSFFTTGAAPSACSPAVGVTISVSENGAPVPGSPFTTDVAGTVVLPVSLGSAVEVREDPQSLPSGYEPLTQEANGVPYANPVQIDSAVAGAAVLFVNVPRSAATELAQDAPAAEAGEPTDLAVVALQCADAPEAETLTSFFSSGTPPSGCAPAVGVSVAVMENEEPLSGSPFTTDADGALAVPVGLGAVVTVKEDPKSLPTGYEPLTQEANGVPYANPVKLDSATADAVVLFVNVPESVAAKLAQDTLAVGAGGATNLAHAVTQDRTGCDPAYPDERTCIAPGRPLTAPCSITDQRNFTVLSPDPRGLDADHDGVGCEPISPRGGTIARDANVNLSNNGGNSRRAAPASTGDVTVAASRVRSDDGVRVSPPESSRANALVVHRDRSSAGLWSVTPSRTSTGNVAIVSNPDFIANGLWGWPNRFSQDDWIWRSRNHNQDGVRFRPSTINAGNVTVAGSGSGNVAIASNPIVISNGVWAWPDRSHGDDWPWRNRFGNGAWFWPNRFHIGNVTIAGSGNGNGNVAIASNPVFIGNGLWNWSGHGQNAGWLWAGHDREDDWSWRNRLGNGVWGWPNRTGTDDWNGHNRFGNHIWGWPSTISVGNLTIASSGSGSGTVAIVSNPVFISSGVWHWPGHINTGGWFWNHGMNNGQWRGPNHFGNRVWGWPRAISVGNLVIARSGDNIAVVSNPIVIISSGLWFVPPDRNRDHDWFDHGDGDHGGRDHAAAQLMQSGSAQTDRSDVEAQAIDGGVASEQPTFTVNGGLAVEPAPADSMPPPSDGAVEPPTELDQPASDGDVALPSEGTIESPSDGTVAAPLDTAAQPPADAGAPDASSVAPDPSTVDSGSVDAGDVDAGYVAPDSGADPGYVAPDPAVNPSYVDPSYMEQEPTYVDAGGDPGYVAPEPSYVEPSYVDPGSVDAGNVDAGYVAPDPVIEPSYSAPQPSYVDPGVDAIYVAPEPNYVAPEPSYVAPEPSYVDAGNGAANPGMDAGSVDAGNAGNAGAGNMAPDPGMDVAGNVDAGGVAPDSGGGGGGRKGNHNHD